MYRLLLPLVLAAVCSMGLTGCGVQASIFPVNETKVEYHQTEKPLYCSFFTCQGAATNEK